MKVDETSAYLMYKNFERKQNEIKTNAWDLDAMNSSEMEL